MKRLRHWLAVAVATGLLAPVLGLALACQTPGASAMSAMNCCRKMHSSCMRGEHAGTESCCRNVAAQPLNALHATHAESGAPALAPTAMAAAGAAAVLPGRRTVAAALAPASPGPRYVLHASLRI